MPVRNSIGTQPLQWLFPPSGIDAGREARESNAEPSSEINAAGSHSVGRGPAHGGTGSLSRHCH
jgi:hypothetical protein